MMDGKQLVAAPLSHMHCSPSPAALLLPTRPWVFYFTLLFLHCHSHFPLFPLATRWLPPQVLLSLHLLILLPQASSPSSLLSHSLSCSIHLLLIFIITLKDYCRNPSEMAFCLFNGAASALSPSSSRAFVHIFSIGKRQRFQMN